MLARAPTAVDWFPDWAGQACAIIASGPSVKSANVLQLRGRLKVLAIKENAYELCPWADVAYGCDLAWWQHRHGLASFKGLKVGWDKRIAAQFPDVKTIEIREIKRQHYIDKLLFDCLGEIGCGGNSGFQALNLAMQFGADRILLIGIDVHDRGGVHWYGRNNWFQGNNPDQYNFARWKRAFENAAPVCVERNVEVINASPVSDLRCFRRASVEQALQDWNL
jgi:hypothetical protein